MTLDNVLVIKINAAGDVVRTTTLLARFGSHVTWITAPTNVELLPDEGPALRTLGWENRRAALDRTYDLVVNLEDEDAPASFVGQVAYHRLFGAYLDAAKTVAYSDDARNWFDLSLISVYGRQRADELKLRNRRTYQDLIFDGLGFVFSDETYKLPPTTPTPLSGDVALAPVAGPVWPMKGWAYYNRLIVELEAAGLEVNVLPQRATLREHLYDVSSHRCLVSGDSLPMHLALGMRTPCVTLFNCTSPWEIYDYGVQTKLVSPRLEQFFYKRGFDSAATTAIRLDDVYDAVMERLRTRVSGGDMCHGTY